MIKRSILTILIFLFTINVFGQSDEVQKLFEPTETDSLYILAIKNFTKQIDNLRNNRNSTDTNPKVIYIQYENYLKRVPNKINGYQILKLGLGNRKEYFRKNKNRLTLVEISPLTLKDGLFSITLIPYGAKLKGKFKMNLTYSSWNTTYFKYINGKLVMDKYESGGI
ncbi:hypothetical protein [[Muricauda] lutisoli]|uniref:DUF4251 domain-containing protein n=1 Tax=[Muricauda] lutisoli TaxID=2816035 RepID=A0ABS3ERQ1_9FLAO|nr:hypothetical protein [[Muricauda] lutisoli]MBO0328923.1 hypothetical protein [[Muricauda] lutisoli]